MAISRSDLNMPTPEEQPDWRIRLATARDIPSSKLVRMPTPAEEPSDEVRKIIALRIEPTILDREALQAEMTDIVRLVIAKRMPADQLEQRTASDEPAAIIRYVILERLAREAGIETLRKMTIDEEPDIANRNCLDRWLNVGMEPAGETN